MICFDFGLFSGTSGKTDYSTTTAFVYTKSPELTESAAATYAMVALVWYAQAWLHADSEEMQRLTAPDTLRPEQHPPECMALGDAVKGCRYSGGCTLP